MVGAMENQPLNGNPKPPAQNWVMAAGLVATGATLAATGIYIGDTDDAPGAALLGLLLLVGSVVLAVRIARPRA
jgi:hypothetical protein